MRSVCESICNHSKEWIKCLGNQLNDYAKRNLFELKAKLDVIFILNIILFLNELNDKSIL